MATALPYLPSNKNLEMLFSKIASAKIPEKFTHKFLYQTLGLKNTNDRAFIPLLRTLGFIDASGTPSATYRLLKNAAAAKGAIAGAIRHAYGPLFEANEDAYKLGSEQLKGLVAQVAGTDEDMTPRIVSTFSALAKLADFARPLRADDESDVDEADDESEGSPANVGGGRPLRPEFHYNIQIHLPSNATEEVYLNIFNAIRKTFQ